MMSVSPPGHKRKARDSNPHDPFEPHGLANRPSKPYLATFHKWTHGESNPDFLNAIQVSSRWTMSPFSVPIPEPFGDRVDRRGVEPRFPGCDPGVFPLDQQP